MNRPHMRQCAMQLSMLVPEIADGILLWGLVTFLPALWIASRFGGTPTALLPIVLLSLCTGYIILRWQRARYRMHRQQLETDARAACLAECLAFDASADLRALAGRFLAGERGWTPIEGTKIWQKDGKRCILAAMRRHPDDTLPVSALFPLHIAARRAHADMCILFATCTPDPDTVQRAAGMGIILLTPGEMAPWLSERYPTPGAETILRRMHAMGRRRRAGRRSRIAQAARGCGRSLRLALSALFLYGLAFLSPYPAWYRLGMLFCAAMAVLSLPWDTIRGMTQKGRKISL